MTPEGWTEARLDQVVAFRRGVSWKKEQERKAPGPSRVPVLRIPNVKERLDLSDLLFVEGFTSDQVDRARVTRGWCVMVGSNGNPKRVGDCVPVDDPQDFVFASFLLGVGTTDENRLDARFMYRLLRSGWVQEDIAESVQGSTGLKNINLNRLRGLRVLLPPLGEQRKIAAILSSVDDAIEATQAVIDQLQVVKKAMMAELLTHGLPGRHTRFKMTEIGEIPEEWEVRRIGDLIETSAYGTSAKSEAGGSGFPVLRIPNVVTESITIEDLKYASLKASEVEAYALRPGDLLVIRTNGNPLYVGRAAVVPQLAGTWLYASYLIRLRVNHAVITPEFLHEAMRSEAVRKTMQGAIRTSAGNYNLNTQGIVNTIVPVPSLTEQAKLTSLTKTIEGRCSAELTYLAELRTVKSALMSVLLTGEVRVKPDEGAPA